MNTHTTFFKCTQARFMTGVRTTLAKACFTLVLFPVATSVWAQDFEALGTAIEQGDFGNLKAVVISRHGEIIYEDYFRGSNANELHQVQSVTKSVGSALIGIAHRQGKIQLEQDMAHFFGDLYPMSQAPYLDKSAITVEQVLQQRHGVQWDESSTDYRNPLNPVAQMVGSNDWYQYMLSQPMDSQPGSRFSYSSGASNLMSRMIRVATGMGPEAFATQALFDPLEIDQVHWEVYSEQGMGTGLTNMPGPNYDVTLGFSLWLKARDLLKFGELYLNGGTYKGKRILDQSWVDASWTKYSHNGNSDFFPYPGWGHGYQWWVAEMPDNRGRNWQVFFASGWGSQAIFVVPELELVLVTAGDNYDYNGPDVNVLLISLLSEMNPAMNQRFDGSWYDPLNDGQGFNLDILDDEKTIVGYWYTYDADGSGNQRWFVLTGVINNGVASVTIYKSSGGVFLQSDPYYLEEWGTGQISSVDCKNIEFTIESEEVSTTLPLTRITGVCYEAP